MPSLEPLLLMIQEVLRELELVGNVREEKGQPYVDISSDNLTAVRGGNYTEKKQNLGFALQILALQCQVAILVDFPDHHYPIAVTTIPLETSPEADEKRKDSPIQEVSKQAPRRILSYAATIARRVAIMRSSYYYHSRSSNALPPLPFSEEEIRLLEEAAAKERQATA